MSQSNDASYQMYKNNMILSYVYVIYTSQPSGSHYNTGTGVMAVQLNVGDTLYVKAYSYMFYQWRGVLYDYNKDKIIHTDMFV